MKDCNVLSAPGKERRTGWKSDAILRRGEYPPPAHPLRRIASLRGGTGRDGARERNEHAQTARGFSAGRYFSCSYVRPRNRSHRDNCRRVTSNRSRLSRPDGYEARYLQLKSSRDGHTNDRETKGNGTVSTHTYLLKYLSYRRARVYRRNYRCFLEKVSESLGNILMSRVIFRGVMSKLSRNNGGDRRRQFKRGSREERAPFPLEFAITPQLRNDYFA